MTFLQTRSLAPLGLGMTCGLGLGMTCVMLSLCIVPPAHAEPRVRGSDPVERASATLSQNLAAQQAEQDRLAQARALELALQQQRAFNLALQTVITQELGQGSVEWLAGRSDPLVTGFTPIPGREGLLVSYQIPAGDSLSALAGRSWTYDNAAGAVAFLSEGRADLARSVLSALQGLMASDGTLGYSYQVDSTFVDSRVRTGTLAWVGYAMALYQRMTGDSSFQTSAERIGGYLRTLQGPTGSLRGGPDVSWTSTEHNIDGYFFYRELYRVTGNAGYLQTANQIKGSLLANHWVKVSNNSGYFLQGLNDPTPSLDANSWGAIFLWAVGRTTEAGQALKYVEQKFKNSQVITGSSTRVTGYAPDTARRTVWLEGTLGVATAYQRLGSTSKADSILGNVYKVQQVWSSQGRWHGALPYAMPRYTNTDGDTFSDLESVPSTAWLLITQSVREGGSPFWDHD